MSSFYSGWVASDDWQLRLDVSVSTSETGCTYNTALFVKSNYATMRNTACSWSITIDGQKYSGSNGAPGVAPGLTVRVASASRTVSRGTSARNVSISFAASFPSSPIASYRSGTSGSGSESLPALRSFTISYNANGGSGAPGNQTKWYGANLTLSNTKPTRTGHDFAGWATSASGAVDYQPGATYTGNAGLTLYAKWTPHTYTVSYNANGGSGAPGSQTKTYGVNLTLSGTRPTRSLYNFKGWGTSAGSTTAAYQPGSTYTDDSAITLYAIWELAWVAPRIINLQATRCNSAGTLTEEGTYAKVTFNWATDRTVSKIAIVCNGVTVNGSGSGTSGSVSLVIGNNALSTEKSYPVTVTVTDAVGSGTMSTTVAPMNYIMDFAPNGSVAIGKPANQTRRCFDVNSIANFTGPVRGFCETGFFNGVTNYKLMVKSATTVNDSSLAGGLRVFGFCGGYMAKAIDVAVSVRSASAGNVFVNPISHAGMGSAAGCVVFRIGTDDYLYCYIKATGYYNYDLRFEGVGFNIVNSPWTSSMVAGTTIFDSSAKSAIDLGTPTRPFGKVYTDNMYIRGSSVSDFVVAGGTSGDWTYRKWESGAAECWKIAKNSGSWHGWGLAFDVTPYIGEQAFPFTFKTPPSVTLGYAKPTAFDGWLASLSQAPQGIKTTSTGQISVIRFTTYTSADYAVSIFVQGRWK